MNTGLSGARVLFLGTTCSCFPKEPLSLVKWLRDWPVCFASLPLPQTIISTLSVSPPLDTLQDKDLFIQHTADLRVFKVYSASKKRKAGKEKKITKLWPY